MSEHGKAIDADVLLAHAGWLRALALRLVHDPDVADDLVQETWIATAQQEPEPRESLRPWLKRVLINALRMRARGDGRRVAREQATLLIGDDVATPEALVVRAEMQRTLVDLVLRLDDPYRTTVLLHFCEGVSLADIARAQGVPAGTVRWRLKTAIDQLRAWLDAKSPRRHWSVALLATSKGIFVANKTSKPVWIALLLLLLVGGGIWWSTRGDAGGEEHVGADQPPSASGSNAAAGLAMRSGEPAEIPAWLGQRDVAARPVAGRVTFRGAPVPGAIVELASLASESGLVAAPRVTTNAAGEFAFGPQRAMEWSVRASAPGKASASVEIDLRDPASRPAPDKLELELGACDAALFGTVRDASGGAIAKARISKLAWTSVAIPGGAAVQSDDKGAYELCLETRWPGWVALEVSAQGYGEIRLYLLVPGRVRADIALVPEATVVGRVVRDDTGEAVAFAHVFVPPDGGGAFDLVRGPRNTESTAWRGTFSDGDGRFRIDRVAPGRHAVFARAEGLAASRGVPVMLEAGQTSAELELRLEAGATVRGVVRSGGKPVAGARVAPASLDGKQPARTAISQEDGVFVLEEVPRGEIRFTARPYDVLSPSTFLVSQPVHEGVVIEVEPLATIAGLVLRGGKPVAGANIYLNGPNAHELAEVRAGADGRFEARGLRPGQWTLFASNDREGAFGRAPPVQLARGATAEVTIELAFSAAIAGRVVDQTGAPVADVSVEFQNTRIDDGGMATTAADGTFRAATMVGGQYRPNVRLSRLSHAKLPPVTGGEHPLITLEGPTSEVTGVILAVKIDRLAISGTIVDATGAPVPDARVVAERLEGNRPPVFFRGLQDPSATSDVDGRFTIGNLSAGSYALLARSASGAEAIVNPIAAGRGDVSIVLAVPGSIEGTLVGFRTPPQVSAVRDGAHHAAPVYGSVTGNMLVLRSLSPGKYLVTARTASEAASTLVDVTAGQVARVTLTSQGSGVVAGRVREIRTSKPVEGMTCRAAPRVGSDPARNFGGEPARTDARGMFTISSAPAGDIVVVCEGLWRLYSHGLRSTTLQAAQRVDLEVLVVGWRNEFEHTVSDFGADVDGDLDEARFVRVKPGGAAAAAGFADGDVVATVDGVAVNELSLQGVWMLLANHPPGTTVKVTATRAGKSIAGELTLREAQGGPR